MGKSPMKMNSKEYFLTIQNTDIYNHFFERMVRMALSQVGYKGLPATCDRLTIERCLLRNGTVAIGRPEGCDFWISVPYTTLGYLDIYGYPIDIRGVGRTNALIKEGIAPFNIKFDEFEVIYDNPTLKGLLPSIKHYAKTMYEIYQTFRSNLRQQRTPYVILTDKDTQLTLENVMLKVDGFDSVIGLRKSDQDALKDCIDTLDTKVEYKGSEILDAFDREWDRFAEDFGFGASSAKRERMNNSEIASNASEGIVGQDVRMIQRIEACNRLNELHDFAKYNKNHEPLEPYMLNDLRQAKFNDADMQAIEQAMQKPDPFDGED